VIDLHENIDDERGIAEIGEMIEPWGNTGEEDLEGLLI
jgi:hypothetical protein